MQLTESKYAKCNKCNQRTHCIQEAVFGCDACKKPINLRNSKRDYLQITVFTHGESDAKHYEFCSWVCVFKSLRTIKTDYFISLPFLIFDTNTEGQTVQDFLKHIKI